MDLFTALQRSFQQRLASQRLCARFERWQLTSEALAEFCDVETLVGSVSGGRQSLPSVDLALRDLCIQAAGGGDQGCADDDATCLLLVLLLEPLVRRSKDPDIAGPLDAEDVQAELAAGVWEAIVSVTPKSSCISSLLVNAGRRRVRTSARRELDHQVRRRPLNDNTPLEFSEAGSAADSEQVIALAQRDGVLNPLEAELIAATRLAPSDPHQVAPLLGLTERAAFLRRDRAETRLLAWLVGIPVPSRSAAPARRDVIAFQGVSGLRDRPGQWSHNVDRKEVTAHRDGLVGPSSRRSDATAPSRVSHRDDL